MKVYYMNGAGNDFMVMDGRGLSPDYAAMAKALCPLRSADGFMAVDHSDKADFRLHFYNSDGTRGEMCGNGARCICRFAHDLGIVGDSMTVETDAGIVPGLCLGEDRYRVELNSPHVVDLNRTDRAAYVELGNPGVPHAVAEYPGDVWADREALLPEMRKLRFHPAFPKGANVSYYSWTGENQVKVLTFERGVEDFTLACGTACGSIATVLYRRGQLPGGILTACNRGGTLTVTVEQTPTRLRLLLEGPAEITEILEIPEIPGIYT